MRIKMKKQITINAPARKTWSVLAHEFENIEQWASVITESSNIPEIPAPEGAHVGGRVCSGSFGDALEKFTYYDDQAMRFGYQGIGKLPSFMKHAENNWSVRSLESNQSVVESRAEIDIKLFPGLILLPIFEFQMWRIGNQLFEELKYYVEEDQPHPRKQKIQQKLRT